jgi:hypothetical protein
MLIIVVVTVTRILTPAAQHRVGSSIIRYPVGNLGYWDGLLHLGRAFSSRFAFGHAMLCHAMLLAPSGYGAESR